MKKRGGSSGGQIIVLGMHRSGTSCIGNLLTKLGVYFGDPSISTGSSEQNRKGFFERRDLRDICDQILYGSGCDWWAVNDFSPDRVPAPVKNEAHAKFAVLLKELDQHEPWFIKEPRLCMVWPLLESQVANPIFLHVWRDPIEVARSLASRNGFPIDFGVALWEAYVRSALAVSRGKPSIVISYNELLDNPAVTTRRLIKELKALGVGKITMPDEAQLRDAVDGELYRERQTSVDLDELIAPSQQTIVQALTDRDLRSAKLFAPLSPVSRVRLDDWVRREGAIVALQNDAVEARRLRQKLRGAEASLTAAHHESAASLASVAEVNAQKNAGLRRMHNIVQFERASPLQLLLKGAAAAAEKTSRGSPNWYPLFLYYLLGHRRKDAGDLASLALSGWFDPEYYVRQSKERFTGDPLIHYVDHGAGKGQNPSALFDSTYYLKMNKDVEKRGLNPLLHFIKHGEEEGRAPRRPSTLEAFRVAQALKNGFSASSPAGQVSSKYSNARVVVYTAVAGGYDQLLPPEFLPPNCDFVVFSDQPMEIEGWQVRPLNYFNADPTRSARFAKLHPHVYFADYDYSIWIDANIGVYGDLRSLLETLSNKSPMSTFVHPLRDCVYVEAQECIKRKKDTPDVITRHVDRYRADGVPEKGGLWETNIVVRRHNDPACIALMNAWWREMEIGSRRDQLSLPVVAQKLGVKISPVGPPGQDARIHPLVALSKHRKRRTGASRQLPAPVRRKVDADSIPVDIGVCVHNGLAETQACLDSLFIARRPQDKIIIVDDASDAPTATFLDQIAKDHRDVALVRHDQNRGYTHSANAVLKNAKSPWVVLLNSDTIVPQRILPKLVTCGEQFPALAVVGPLSNAAGWQTVPQLTGADGKFMVNSLPETLSVDDMDRLCEGLSDGVVPFVPLVNGFCFAMRQSAIEQIGPFDEKNFPVGYGEEDDFCLRAGAAGFLCGLATDTYVFHSKSASFTPERRLPLVKKGGAALRMKHSEERVAAAVETMKRHPYLVLTRQRIGEALRKNGRQKAI